MSNNICNIIQIEIRSKNFTLEHIASQMGSTRSSIYKMIRNPNISAVNLHKLSQILGYNFFNHFYIDSNHPTTDQWHEERRQNRHLNRELKKITEQYQTLQQANEFLTSQLSQLSKANITPQPPEPPTE